MSSSIVTATKKELPEQSWPEFLKDVTLFDNAIRLRSFIWTLQRYVHTGAQLLEAGCGSGTAAVLLADLGYQVTACDLNAELVARLRHKYSNWISSGQLEVQHADILKLPWPDKHFDVVYHQGVLEHFDDQTIVRALKEQCRVARLVIFDIPNGRSSVQPYGDERLLPVRHWRKLISAAGLEVVAERGRDFHRYLYFLPNALFSHYALDSVPSFGRWFAVNSIFVCRGSL
jgi:SAM-dependent methyltransferase